MSSLLLTWRASVSECSAALHNVVPLPAPVSVSTPDEPESFFNGDTPSSEEDPFGWGGDFDQDHRTMSDQKLPLGPDKRVETAQMDCRLSGDPASALTMEDTVLAVCAPGTSEVLYGAVERAGSCQGHVEVECVAAVDSRDFPGTMDYTRDDAAGASFDPGTASLAQPRAHSGVEDYAEGFGTQTTSISNSATMAVGPTPGAVVARNRSRSPRRLEGREETFGLTVVHLSHQFGFRDATLWCWKCGGWSAACRLASRLKDPCGVPTKTGADVVYLVSGGFSSQNSCMEFRLYFWWT